MMIFCPCCHGLVGHLAGKVDADAHYLNGCPFCHGATATAKTMATADTRAAQSGTAWVDEDGDPVTSEVEGPPGP